ncbi:ABC transporter ATP-binding protein [Aestuariivirga litoralis]|uniref:ABC transporter ATP-binding protein n=1 Tax=Aestuariivirga litoralis TaxID=2650924 RepID=UPI0018C64954|nr:ABC transporter ATP-binding protein [Aestuariivirga litoralis]MBG1232323.1 ABC transporter ATP-binding protein [Aestuariivirga litoralis]
MQEAVQNKAHQSILARDLALNFGGVRAVDGMSISLQRGELLGLIGPNGAGKTTLFNMLAGAFRPQSGSILINGAEAAARPASARIGLGLGRTFQIPKPFPEMTVLENVLTGAQGQAGEGLFANFLQLGKVAAQERAALEKARGLLEFVTLTHLAQEPARVLSGGQRKLLELARILMADPSIILLDEPAAGVNPALLEFIMSRVLDLNAQGKSILLIEHNMDMITRLCSRVVVMAQGKFLTEGKPQDVSRNEAVVEAYLGGAA